MESGPDRKILKAAIVNTSELMHAQARDIGNARMTESKEDRSGNIIARTVKRIWKHNLAQEWYRQREVSRARKEILETNNLYAGEKEFDPDQTKASKASDSESKEAMQAIIDRFISEYDDEDVLRKGESRDVVEGEIINTNLKDLIKYYAANKMSEIAFKQEKERILSAYDKKYADPKSMYADNLLTIANEVRDAVNQGAKLAELDFEVELTLGDARESLHTEADQTEFDKGVEWMQSSKVGKWVANDAVALGITAGLYEVGRNALQKTVRSKAAQLATFGLASIAAGSIGAVKENVRIKRERAQHQRESAKGMQFNEKDMKRRQEMELNSYDTKKATIIIQNLNEDLEKIKEGQTLSEDQIQEMIGRLADIEARYKIADDENIDLITYDKNRVERDSTSIDLKRAELKKLLRGIDREDGAIDFDIELEHMSSVQEDQILEGVEKKNEIFEDLRKSKVKWAFAKSALTAATIGTAFQEARAFFTDTQDGILEGAFGNKEHLVSHGTALEALRRYITGEHAPVSTTLHAETFSAPTHVEMPDNVTFNQDPNPDGTYDLLKDGKVIAGHVPVSFDEQGDLSDVTKKALMEHGITSGQLSHYTEQLSQPAHLSATEYIQKNPDGMHQVHRVNWYNNDTKAFDKNELAPRWGGDHGTGINNNGKYVFNMSHMMKGGSFHGAEHIDAIEEIKKGGLKMIFSLSKGTQHQVFEVPIDTDGNAIIDPQSPLGKLMFENHDGHAVFTGRFAEVVHVTGIAADGGENVDILATHEGGGKDFVDTVIGKDITVPRVLLNVPNENTFDAPPIIPIRGRRPLEKGRYKTNREVEASRPREQDESSEENPLPYTMPGTKQGDVGAEMIPEGGFRADVAEDMRYSQERGFEGKEQPIDKKTDHIYAYGVTEFKRADVEAQLKKDKHKHPEVLVLENDRNNREKNLKEIAYLKKWYPKVTFTYVALPDRDTSGLRNKKDMYVYNTDRLAHILNESKIDPNKIKHQFIKESMVSTKSLGEISEGEWNKFTSNGNVSQVRMKSIAEKLKTNPVLGSALTPKEQLMYLDKKDKIDRIIKK